MKAIRKNSVIVKKLERTNALQGFQRGEVLSTNHEGLEVGDIVLYSDSIPMGEEELVLDNNILAKE